MNKSVKKTILLAIALCSSWFGFSQDYKSFPLNKASMSANGVYYCLPRTEIVFDVCVEKINEYKGCYADYAYMLGLKNIVINDQVSYRIKDIKISTRAIADSEHSYFLATKPETNVQLSNIGTLIAINPDPNKAPHHCKGECDRPKHRNKPSNEEEIQTKPMFERRMLANGMLESSPEMTPEQVVKHIASLRERQTDILSGNTEGTYMNTTVDFMYKQLDEMIDAYVALFSGERESEYLHYTFSIVPDKPMIVEQDLLAGVFKFSETEGVKPLSYSGNIPTVVANLHSLNTTKSYVTMEDQKSKDEKLQSRIDKKGVGVYYRIPEQVEVTINCGEKVFSKRISIAQFGQTSYLLSSPQRVVLSPKDGSLKYAGK